MLTVIEKVIFLQHVEVFSEVSTEQMAYIAAIVEEVEFLKAMDIYREQDLPDAIYLVVEGKVRLHRDGSDIALIGPQEAFGTWALFDEEPRVATATTVDDTRLLRVSREEFIDLLSDHVQITQGVLRALTKRLRGLIGEMGTRAAR
ncbi:MAG: Crp/Fnr family transcriptional regulator [Nitrospirales bacterium]